MWQKYPLDNFKMFIPKVSQAKCYVFFIILPPPPPLIVQTAKMFFITTWDALETSGLDGLASYKNSHGIE